MVIYMKENGKMIKRKEKENIYIIMIINFKVYLKMIKNMKEMDIFIMKMEIYIMAILKME